MATESANSRPDAFTVSQRQHLIDVIAPGLERLKAGLAKNKEIRNSSGFFDVVIRHMLKVFDRDEMLFRGLPADAPVYLLPEWYAASAKEWVLGLEPLILTISEDEATRSFLKICEATLQAGEEALAFFDSENEVGRAYRFRLEELRLAANQFSLQRTQAAVAEAGERVNEIVAHAAEAAGSTANSGMAGFFHDHAESERKRYRLWIAALSFAVAGSVGIAGYVVARMGNSTFSAEEVARLALALPILAFAAFASRQANYHRDAESSSRLVAVQLRTVNAFTDALDPNSRVEIMRALGQSVFSSGVGNSPPAATPSYGLPAEVVQLLQDILARSKSEGK